ncbi:MAG: iron-sulfur cluster repair di-iron protein [Candidatus Eisenbacteria bacterium]|nr:iron-sulfur cluster repair di-iron protein [Candidatus Eisenbacteria bacterium]
MSTLTGTIRDYVTQDFRTAAVFEKYGLDFCCGGGLPLEEACRKKGLHAAAIREDLASVMTSPTDGVDNPAAWDTGRLVDHIVQIHHGYVRSILPVIQQHARKVAGVHGALHPETLAIADQMDRVAVEMTSHMDREEGVLFPHVKQLAEAAATGTTPPRAPFGTIASPIALMEAEHLAVGNEMADVRRLSNQYTPPVDACTTYRVLYEELAQFEADLHRHVHLENNILFPRATALERLED